MFKGPLIMRCWQIPIRSQLKDSVDLASCRGTFSDRMQSTWAHGRSVLLLTVATVLLVVASGEVSYSKTPNGWILSHCLHTVRQSSLLSSAVAAVDVSESGIH